MVRPPSVRTDCAAPGFSWHSVVRTRQPAGVVGFGPDSAVTADEKGHVWDTLADQKVDEKDLQKRCAIAEARLRSTKRYEQDQVDWRQVDLTVSCSGPQ